MEINVFAGDDGWFIVFYINVSVVATVLPQRDDRFSRHKLTFRGAGPLVSSGNMTNFCFFYLNCVNGWGVRSSLAWFFTLLGFVRIEDEVV